MKKVTIVNESLFEFAKRGRPRKNANPKSVFIDDDVWKDVEDEDTLDPEDYDVDTSDMENVEEIEITDDSFDDDLYKVLSTEIKMSEPSRRTLVFKLKSNMNKIEHGIPIAKMGNNAFIFKLDDGRLKKIFLSDIIVESANVSRARKVKKYFLDNED